MGYKIFVHEIYSDYAARIDNFRSYGTVSKDIIHRPDIVNAGNGTTQPDGQGTYRASGMDESFSIKLYIACSYIGSMELEQN